MAHLHQLLSCTSLNTKKREEGGRFLLIDLWAVKRQRGKSFTEEQGAHCSCLLLLLVVASIDRAALPLSPPRPGLPWLLLYSGGKLVPDQRDVLVGVDLGGGFTTFGRLTGAASAE
jgi:hypothetical protein